MATFEVGYDQDIAAVDIQNKVQTATPQLPPEVKQYGVSIKKTSTDIVCVVNLVDASGKGLYDATFLDNYGQIYVADSLKRIKGVSDITVIGRKYAMRVWIDPNRMAEMRISPTELIQAIQQENLQAAAGKIGGRAGARGAGVRVPDHGQGAAHQGVGVRGDHRPPQGRRLDRPAQGRGPGRAVVGELRDGQLPGRQAGRRRPGLPVCRRQRPGDRRGGPPPDGPARQVLPGGTGIPHRLRHDRSMSRRTSTRSSTRSSRRSSWS